MSKPKSIKWLEEQTGQTIEYSPETSDAVGSPDRHLSVRLPGQLAGKLDSLAADKGMTVSQFVRSLIDDALLRLDTDRQTDSASLLARLDADVAEVRRRLAG
jgi:Ribbon-helix-helix protein, copG family